MDSLHRVRCSNKVPHAYENHAMLQHRTSNQYHWTPDVVREFLSNSALLYEHSRTMALLYGYKVPDYFCKKLKRILEIPEYAEYYERVKNHVKALDDADEEFQRPYVAFNNQASTHWKTLDFRVLAMMMGRYKMDYRTVAIKMEINVNVVRRNWNTIKGKDEYLAIYTRHKRRSMETNVDSSHGTRWEPEDDRALVQCIESEHLTFSEAGERLGRTRQACQNRFKNIRALSRGGEDAQMFCIRCRTWKEKDEFKFIQGKDTYQSTCMPCLVRYKRNTNTPEQIIRRASISAINCRDKKLIIAQATNQDTASPPIEQSIDEVHSVLMKAYRLSDEACFYCEAPIHWDTSSRSMFKATIDHVYPNLWTLHEDQVMVWACHGCNSGKWARSFEEYADFLHIINKTTPLTINHHHDINYDLSSYLQHHDEALMSPWNQKSIEGLPFLSTDEWAAAKLAYARMRQGDDTKIGRAAAEGYKVKGTTMTRMEFEIMVRAVGLYDAWTGVKGTWISGQILSLSMNRKINSSIDENGTRFKHLHSVDNCNILLIIFNRAILDFDRDEQKAWLTRIQTLKKIDIQAKVIATRKAMTSRLPLEEIDPNLPETSSSTPLPSNAMENQENIPESSSSTPLPLHAMKKTHS